MLLRRAGRAAALTEVEPSIEVALGAKRRAEDMAMVVCGQLRSEEMTIDGLSVVGWGDEKPFLQLWSCKVGRSSRKRGANLRLCKAVALTSKGLELSLARTFTICKVGSPRLSPAFSFYKIT